MVFHHEGFNAAKPQPNLCWFKRHAGCQESTEALVKTIATIKNQEQPSRNQR